jgi:hypothetical protein
MARLPPRRSLRIDHVIAGWSPGPKQPPMSERRRRVGLRIRKRNACFCADKPLTNVSDAIHITTIIIRICTYNSYIVRLLVKSTLSTSG